MVKRYGSHSIYLFQQVGGLECKPVTGEVTYGLERLAMYIQGVDSVYDLVWSDGPLGKTTYGDVFHQNEVEQSTYNFEYVDTDFLFYCFDQYEKEAKSLLELERPLPLPAYERILKAAHSFNLLDARKAISVTERQRYILRIRALTKGVAEAYYASREALGFPGCKKIGKKNNRTLALTQRYKEKIMKDFNTQMISTRKQKQILIHLRI